MWVSSNSCGLSFSRSLWLPWVILSLGGRVGSSNLCGLSLSRSLWLPWVILSRGGRVVSSNSCGLSSSRSLRLPWVILSRGGCVVFSNLCTVACTLVGAFGCPRSFYREVVVWRPRFRAVPDLFRGVGIPPDGLFPRSI